MNVREKLVELLSNIYLPMMAGQNAIGEYSIPHKFKKEIADHLIAHGVTVQEWISVKDRLPKLDEEVLVSAKDLHIKTNYYEVWSLFKCHSGELIWVDNSGDGYNLTEVTHWMPLPQPPKGE